MKMFLSYPGCHEVQSVLAEFSQSIDNVRGCGGAILLGITREASHIFYGLILLRVVISVPREYFGNSRIGLKWGNGVHTTYYISMKTTLSNKLADASNKYIRLSQTELELFQKWRSRNFHRILEQEIIESNQSEIVSEDLYQSKCAKNDEVWDILSTSTLHKYLIFQICLYDYSASLSSLYM